GDTPGRTNFGKVILEVGSALTLNAGDNTKVFLQNVETLGDATLVNDASQTRIFIGNVTGVGTLSITGNKMNRLVGDISSAAALSGWGIIETTGQVTGSLTVNGGANLFVAKTMNGNNITVNTDGTLTVADAGFTKGTLNVANRGIIGLAVDLSMDDSASAGQSRLYISKEAYAGTLTLGQNNTQIGSDITDLASILNPIAGTATQIEFAGGSRFLSIADGVLSDLDVGGTALRFDRNVRLLGDSATTGAVTVASNRVVAMSAGSLGSGAVAVDGELEVQADNFDGGVLTVNGRLDINSAGILSDVRFSGGTIQTHGDASVAGSLTEDDNITFEAAAGSTLTFDNGVALAAARQWTVSSGTVAFDGAVTGDQDLTKAGAGILRLNGANAINLLTLGTSPGGVTVIGVDGTVATSVLINAEAAYSVEKANHAYGEVDFAGSAGTIALGADVNDTVTLTMENSSLSLGAFNDSAFDGTLTPYSNVYQLGGGGGVLTFNSQLTDVDALETSVVIGLASPAAGDIGNQGMVILTNSANDFTGYLDIYMAAGITDLDVVASGYVSVNTGGSLDIGAADVTGVHNITMNGGGVARNGGSLSAADLAGLFIGDYVIGGGVADAVTPGADTTTVLDGALADWVNFTKVGANTVVLAAPATPRSSLNLYNGETKVEGGRLIVNDITSLGDSQMHTVKGSAVMEFVMADKDLDYSIGGIQLADTATLQVNSGQYLTASGLTLQTDTTRAVLSGGGTLDLGMGMVASTTDNTATIEITDGSTLITRLGNTDQMRSNMFIVRGGGTLDFATAEYVRHPSL
ncbi:MAG: hypothetical protein IMZ65_01140, partial [Planctomycetes bacterium]|nr:hypothetical protein [Planctomycetota bacterium]